MKQSIGFVGLGQMGQPIALNLLRAGFELRVFDVREERLAPLVGRKVGRRERDGVRKRTARDGQHLDERAGVVR